MVRPAVSATTERTYGRLPAFYRADDAEQHEGTGDHYPLLRFLSTVGDRGGEVETLLDRIDLDPGSELTDPDLADVGWLPWLAQHVGVQLEPKLTEAERRDAIRYSSAGWRGGTKRAVADAAKTVLTGSKYAQVDDHSTSRSAAGQAGQWDVLIVTRPSETPSPELVLETVRAKEAKPAGVRLYHEAYAATWDTLHTKRPTWADWNGVSWSELEETLP